MVFPEVNESGDCVACGKKRVIGDFPKCPHATVGEGIEFEYFQDQIPGGMVLENGFPEPVTVYSWSQMEALYKQHGLQMKEKWCPAPGTDVDPAGIQNPDRYQDSYTLRAGAALMMRQQGVEDDASIDVDKLFIPRESPEGAEEHPGPFLRKSGQYKLCPTCQGVKTVQQLDPDDPDVTIEVYCPTCSGSGLVEVTYGKRRRS